LTDKATTESTEDTEDPFGASPLSRRSLNQIVRRENCFVDLADPERAQALMDQQLKTDWRSVLDGIVAAAHPAHGSLFGTQSNYPIDHYWSVSQSEWASKKQWRRLRKGEN
jgi:hypothetical protein